MPVVNHGMIGLPPELLFRLGADLQDQKFSSYQASEPGFYQCEIKLPTLEKGLQLVIAGQ